MSFEDQEVLSLVRTYELSLEEGRGHYFDVDDLEAIVNYYLDLSSLAEVQQAIAYARELHPRSIIFKIKSVQLDIAQKNFANAQAKIHALEGLGDSNTELLVAKATLLLHQGDRKRALEMLDEALETAEDPIEVLQAMVDAHLSQGEYLLAATALEKLCDLDDELDEGTVYQLALCLDFTHNFDRAIALFEKYTSREPYNPLLWYQLGAFWTRRRNEQKAEESFRWAVTADDTFHAAYFELGRIYEQRNDLIQALTAYRQSVSAEVASGYIHFRIGMIEQELGCPTEALRSFTRAIEIEDDLDDVHLERAHVLYELKRYDKAAIDYYVAWEDESFEEEDVLDFVECLIELDRLHEAISILIQAKTRFEDSFQLRLVLAGYLFATDDLAEAERVLIESLALNKNAIVLFEEYFPELLLVPNIPATLARIQEFFND